MDHNATFLCAAQQAWDARQHGTRRSFRVRFSGGAWKNRTPYVGCAGSARVDAALWQREICDEAEMIAGPNPIDWFVECKLAGRDTQCRPAMPPTAYEDVVDALKRPIP